MTKRKVREIIEIAGRNNWKSLNLTGQKLTKIPEEICWLPNLTTLYLSRNQITTIPDSLAKLTNLTGLSLSDNLITTIPDSLGDLTDLTGLDLSNNKIMTIPESLARLTNLTRFSLSGNRITTIPDLLGDLINLAAFDLSGNKIMTIPEALGGLTNLTWLSLSVNDIKMMPELLGRLTNLEYLDLSMNDFTIVANSLGRLANLEVLRLNLNRISIIPSTFADLSSLLELHLYSNDVRTIPVAITRLTNLKTLNLAENEIGVIPGTLCNLVNLTELDLSGNQIMTIPESLGNLANLAGLFLSDNQITTIPESLAALTKLTEFDLSDNPLDYPPEVVEEGGLAILQYLRDLHAGGTKRYEAKLIIVGQGGVGKTCLSRALRGLPFQEQVTTYGIEVQKLIMKHPGIPGQDITINLWDFGGQEIAHSTHQFFLTQRSLYLLVFNSRLEAETARLEYWLDTIRARTPRAKVLLVATQCFERTPRLDYGRLKGRYPELLVGDDYFRVDSEKENGIKELKGEICRHISTLELMGHPWPKAYANVEVAIEACTENKRAYLLRKGLGDIMTTNGLETEQKRDMLARILGDLGKITHFPDSFHLRDHIILNPQWLTHAISLALEYKPLDDAHGVLEHKWLVELWSNDYSGMHSMFHRCMEEFEICYPIEGDPHRSLVPLRFQPRKPEIEWSDDPDRITRRLIYRFQFVPAGVMARFIVKTYRMTTGQFWEYGVFLRKGEAEALCEYDYQKREITIEVRSVYPQNFLEKLSEYLESILDEYEGLKPEKLLACTGEETAVIPCAGEFPYEELQDATHHGIEEVRCYKGRHNLKTLDMVYGLKAFADHWNVLKSIQADIKAAGSDIRAVGASVELLGRKLVEIYEQQQKVLLDWMWAADEEIFKLCPTLVSIVPVDRSTLNPKNWVEQKYQLRLFCQHEEEIHPVGKSYEFTQPREWWETVSPYLSSVATLAWVVAGPAGGLLGTYVPPATWDAVKNELEAMNAFLESIDIHQPGGGKVRPGLYISPFGRKGAAMRAMSSLLNKLDPDKSWKDILFRVKMPDDRVRWLCKEHLDKYLPPPAQF